MFLTKKEDLPRIFSEQLEKCGVDYFDYYLIHNLGVINYAIAEKLDAFDFVQKKKAEGKIKKIGFSFHGDIVLVNQYRADLYFESAGMILTLITLGKFLESKSKGKTSEAIEKLMIDTNPI